MDINNLISESQICTDIKGNTKKEIISSLVDILDSNGKLYEKSEFLEDVVARENSISTGIGDGIAMPHGKSKAVKQASLALGICREGIDFDSFDNKPVHIIFLIAAPDEADDLHLKILSTLSRKLMHEEFREALQNAKTEKEIMSILNN